VSTGWIRIRGDLLTAVVLLLWGLTGAIAGEPAPSMRLSWTNNLLTVHDAQLPGGRLEVWYLEAFLKPGAQDRDWNESRL